MKTRITLLAVTLLGGFYLALPTQSTTIESVTISGAGNLQGKSRATTLESFATGTVVPGTVPDYQWWYGCSPTAAGMMVGYYDINGYSGETFTKLVPGGVADSSTFPSVEGNWDYNVQHIIASQRHVGDYYGGGYLASGDDVPGAPTGPLDSLSDFMGTSQDAAGNVNGGTTFYFWNDGSRTTVADIYNYGLSASSGTYGIHEYLQWSGYGDVNPTDVDYIYNQYADSMGLAHGFTFADFRAEIDAGRVVMIHIENHTMLGYGYDAASNEIFVRDSSTAGEHVMPWGGSYLGHALIAVTVLDLTGIKGDPKTVAPNIVPFVQYLLLD